MYFIRPSFRRGGPTGIAQLNSNRQMYAGGGNIGGGIIAGSNLGSRTGFSVLDIISGSMAEEMTGGSNQKPTSNKPTNVTSKTSKLNKAKNILQRGTSIFKNPQPGTSNPFFINQLRNIYSKVPKPSGIFSALRTGAAAAPVTATLAIPAATTFGLMQMNKAKTVEALEYMKSMNQSGVFDETAAPEDYEEYTKVFNYLNENGTPISFTENFASDETLEKIKDEGRTKISSDMDAAAAKKAMTTDDAYSMDEIVDSVVTDKNKKTIDEPEEKEKSFEDIYQTEFDRIQKLIGDDDSKGMAAIALSEAIGTPGTIADKAAVLNKSLAQIMAGKKKDKKEIAKLAYSATKEIEKAKIAAGKTSDSQKNFERIQNLTAIINDTTGTYSETEKKSAGAQLEIIKESIKILNPKERGDSLTGLSSAGKYIDELSKLAKKINKQEKGSAKYNELLKEYMALSNFLRALNNNAVTAGVATTDAIIGLTTKKDGGRIKLAKGTPIEESVQVSETVGQGETPTAQVQKLSYDELRNRLPKEITDDVIRLIANSNEALQDFAYIRTQGDVVKFNTKYGVNLVLPAQTA